MHPIQEPRRRGFYERIQYKNRVQKPCWHPERSSRIDVENLYNAEERKYIKESAAYEVREKKYWLKSRTRRALRYFKEKKGEDQDAVI